VAVTQQTRLFGVRSTAKPVDFLCEGIVFLSHMEADYMSRITVEPGKCGGRPCIRGYRIRVTDVLELLASGATENEILAEYPFLEQADIRAALNYAAHQTDHVVLNAQ
jgi:uncharacterized protein (DUF433 family)